MARDALVVGINQYQSLPALQASARDAEAIAQRLHQWGEFRVQRLPERIQSGVPQVGQRLPLSTQALESALVKLFKPKGRHVPETALFYFSGHGLQKDSGLHEGYLATSEADPQRGFFGLSLFWLRRLLQESPVRQRIIWLDCCHSGALLDFSEVDPGAVSGTSQFLMAASRDYESAYESLGSEYSVLTEAILEGLAPQRVESGEITNHSLTDWVNNQLKGELQQPLFENSGEAIWLTRSQPVQTGHAAQFDTGQSPGIGQEETPSRQPVQPVQPVERAATVQAKTPAKTIADIPTPIAPPPPFPGIRAFSTSQAYAFTGREELTQMLLQAVHDNSVVSLVGGASSGKTSLIQAGLLPQLQQCKGQAQNQNSTTPAPRWLTRQVTFGQYKQPLIDLAAAFIDAGATEWEQGEQLRRNSLLLAGDMQGLLQLVEQQRLNQKRRMPHDEDGHGQSRSSLSSLGERRGSDRLLLVLDSVEMLLQPSSDPEMGMLRRQVMINLSTLIREASDWVRLVLVVRSDYWEACYRMTDLLQQGPSRMVGIEPLDSKAMERAIVRPLQRAGWSCDPLLPSMLLSDIGQSPARMALMQLVLRAMWEQHQSTSPASGHKTFEIKTYVELGGIRGLLVHQATHLLETLTPEEQALVQQIFLALTHLGQRTPDSLRSISRTDLGIGAAANARSDELVAVLETLIESRLVYSGSHRLELPSEVEREESLSFLPLHQQNDWLQASHEALIRDWPALQDWLKRERSRLQRQRRIESAAQDWCDRNEMFVEDSWLQGSRLREAEAYLCKHPHDLSVIAQRYIHLSQEAGKKTRRETRLLQLGLPTALTATLFALVHQYFSATPPSQIQQLQALQIRETTRKILSNPEADPMSALLINRLALGQEHSMTDAETTKSRPTEDRTTEDRATQQIALEGISESLRSLQIRGRFQGRSELTALQWTDDQQTLVGLTAAGQAYAWQVAPILADSPSEGGRGLGIRQRTHSTIQQRLAWPNQSPPVPSVLMNSLLPMGWGEHASRTQGTHTQGTRTQGTQTERRTAQAPTITSLSLSPDNRQVAAIAQETPTVALWSLGSTPPKQLPETFATIPQQILYRPPLQIQPSASNQPETLLAIVAGRTVHLWNPVSQPEQPMEQYGTLEHLSPVEQIAFSREGQYLLSSAGDRRLRLWNLETGIQEQELTASMQVAQIQMSPSSNLIAALGQNGMIRVWDRRSGDRLHAFKLMNQNLANQNLAKQTAPSTPGPNDSGQSTPQQSDSPQQLQFSADESHLVIVQAGRAWVWDLTRGQLLKMIQLPPHTGPVRISPDGNLLLAIENRTMPPSNPLPPQNMFQQQQPQQQSQAHLWNLQTGEKLRVLRESKQALQEARFSPDGQMLVTASQGGQMTFWDSQPGYELPPLVLPEGDAIAAKDFIQLPKVIASTPSTPPPTPGVSNESSSKSSSESSSKKSKSVPWKRLNPRQFLRLPEQKASDAAASSIEPELLDAETTESTVSSESGVSSPAFLLMDSTGFLNRWDVALGLPENLTQIDVESEVIAADWTPDLTAIATAHPDGSIHLWDLPQQTPIQLEGLPEELAATESSNSAKTENQADEKSQPQSQQKSQQQPMLIKQLQLSQNGRILLGLDRSNKLHLWTVETGQRSLWPQAMGTVQEAQLSATGDRLLTATATGEITLWNVETGQQIRQWSLPGFTALALDETGQSFVAALAEGDLQPFSANSELQTWPTLEKSTPGDVITTLTIGSGQLVAGTRQGEVRVWNRATGRVVRQLQHPAHTTGAPASLAQVSLSADGRWLAAVTDAGQVAFWAGTADQLKELARDRSFRSLTRDECVAYLQLSEADCGNLEPES